MTCGAYLLLLLLRLLGLHLCRHHRTIGCVHPRLCTVQGAFTRPGGGDSRPIHTLTRTPDLRQQYSHESYAQRWTLETRPSRLERPRRAHHHIHAPKAGHEGPCTRPSRHGRRMTRTASSRTWRCWAMKASPHRHVPVSTQPPGSQCAQTLAVNRSLALPLLTCTAKVELITEGVWMGWTACAKTGVPRFNLCLRVMAGKRWTPRRGSEGRRRSCSATPSPGPTGGPGLCAPSAPSGSKAPRYTPSFGPRVG